MDKPFQRKGALSNSNVGRAFELAAQYFFSSIGLTLQTGLTIQIGINGTKPHRFDLGNPDAKVLIECKSHKWTETDGIPSAKVREWNEAMYLFYASPSDYRKILFVMRDYSKHRNETLAQYYIRTNKHLIPKNVEIWEYSESETTARRLL